MFDVFNQLGPGYNEKTYEKAIIQGLKSSNIKFKNQIPAQLIYQGQKVGKFYLDFLIDDKIILEIKVGRSFSK